MQIDNRNKVYLIEDQIVARAQHGNYQTLYCTLFLAQRLKPID